MAEDLNRYIRQCLEMARQLTILADEGEADCSDDGCAVLYGIVRDCAYKIRSRAEHELAKHKHHAAPVNDIQGHAVSLEDQGGIK